MISGHICIYVSMTLPFILLGGVDNTAYVDMHTVIYIHVHVLCYYLSLLGVEVEIGWHALYVELYDCWV